VPDEFWRSTPRVILAAIKGYWRRRGWMAWHIAMLSRCEASTFPALNDLTGEPLAAQPLDEMLRNLRLVKAAQVARKGQQT